MSLTYFKRYRMEIDLTGRQLVPPPLPAGYRLVPWDESLLEATRRNEVPQLSGGDRRQRVSLPGRLGRLPPSDARDPRQARVSFPGRPGSIAHDAEPAAAPEYCGTIQGIRDYAGLGAIQNLGVTPEHRGRQLGTCLLIQALEGFQRATLRRALPGSHGAERRRDPAVPAARFRQSPHGVQGRRGCVLVAGAH